MDSNKRKLEIETNDQLLDTLCCKINPELVLKYISTSGNFSKYTKDFDALKRNDIDVKQTLSKRINENPEDLLHILLYTGQDEAAKLLDLSVEDLCDFSQCDPKYKNRTEFSFGDSNPEDQLERPADDRSQSSSMGRFSMSKSPRGYCILIVNYFTVGTYKEMQRLRSIFYRLHFEVIMEKNLTINEIIKKITDLSKSTEITEPDAIVLIFIGFKSRSGEIMDYNKDSISITELKTLLSNSNFPQLKEKPRLLFFNCCQNEHQENNDKKRPKTQTSENVENKHTDSDPSFVCYARFESDMAESNWSKETVFGQELADSLVKRAWSRDLESIIRRVNSKVKEKSGNEIEWHACQMKKSLYFDPQVPQIRANLSNNAKKDSFVLTTMSTRNRSPTSIGNGIFIYSDIFISTDRYIIFRGYFGDNSIEAAVKKYSAINIDLYDEEKELLFKLNKENKLNFPKYLANSSCKDGYYIATELAEMSLKIFIENNFNRNFKDNYLLKMLEDICKGLETLHKISIIHSAIEPRNILLSFPDKTGNRRAMITNIGMNRSQISEDLDSLSWLSFEVINTLKKNEIAVFIEKDDIFSLGCIIYFTLTNGKYIFGKGFKRFQDVDTNFDPLNTDPTYVDLIRSMVTQSDRLSIDGVLIHPTFWTSAKKLLFFTHIKNVLFTNNRESNMKTQNFIQVQKSVIEELDNKADEIIGGNDWLKKLCPDVQKYENNKRKHAIRNTNSVKELINFIRNKDQHWDELKADVLRKFGDTQESYISYFLGRFKFLLINTYNAMKKLKCERNLQDYYIVD